MNVELLINLRDVIDENTGSFRSALASPAYLLHRCRLGRGREGSARCVAQLFLLLRGLDNRAQAGALSDSQEFSKGQSLQASLAVDLYVHAEGT